MNATCPSGDKNNQAQDADQGISNNKLSSNRLTARKEARRSTNSRTKRARLQP
jgi:hypothetical protein